jgi:Phage Mu protein F like protein
MHKECMKVLKQAAKDVSKQIKAALKNRKVRKDDDDADDIILDLSAFDILVDVAPEIFERLMNDSGARALAQVGVQDRSELVNQVYQYSVDYAQERSAELVGKKWINGVLVDNPNAEWSLPDATRDEIKGIITDAFAGRILPESVESSIREAGAFSAKRATLIARTEITRANSYGSLAGYKAAASVGVILRKAWLPDADACPICLDNADDGDIALDEQFSSGDDAPPAHPRCECSIIPITEGNEIEDDEGD